MCLQSCLIPKQLKNHRAIVYCTYFSFCIGVIESTQGDAGQQAGKVQEQGGGAGLLYGTVTHDSCTVNEMTSVLGHDSALLRLYWAGDNLG